MINDLKQDNHYYNGDMIPTFKGEIMSAIPIRVEPKSLTRRIFFLRQAQERAQDPKMKKLWEWKTVNQTVINIIRERDFSVINLAISTSFDKSLDL